jgi:hypothetical protein
VQQLRRNNICIPPLVGACGLGCRTVARGSYHVEQTRRCIALIPGILRVLSRERMALAQIRFLPRERMGRKRLYSASTSCPPVGTLAASCRAGNFGETIFVFLLWWGLADLGATLSLAGPTMWKDEELHRLDIEDNSFPPT